MTRAEQATDLARGAADWLLELPAGYEYFSLYQGRSGVVLALQEAAQHFGDDRYAAGAEAGVAAIVENLDRIEDSSLYGGLVGVAVAFHHLGHAEAARDVLDRVRSRVVDGRWGDMFELLFGNAGIGLGALAAGDLELAVDAVTPYVETADQTAGGVNWPVRSTPSRSHHMAHGTLGIVHALAAVGQAAGRQDLIDLALLGAADVVHRNEAGPDGFLVPHSDPQHRPELIERYSLGWCNGPAGDAQAFRLLAQVTGDPVWTSLGDACWHTVTESGLPQRIRPGFWDNHGRCCGTAGVLALACDRIVERGDDFGFADVLFDDLAQHAIADESGARWSNYEHRAESPDLEPVPGWAMGNAGILRELLRYARLKSGRPGDYALTWPDHPTATA